MCRFIAYVGPPVTLAALTIEPAHALLRQSYAPRHQPPGRLNADGFGIGWFAPEVRPEPAVYRTAMPMWDDATFGSFAGVVSAPAVLGSLRAATPGFPIDLPSVAPFASDGWLFAHNGSVDGFRDGVGEELRRGVSVRRASQIDSVVDSAVLFAMTLDRLDRGEAPAESLAGVVADVKQAAGGKLNLVLTDGARIAATAFGNSLFTRAAGSTIVASEPYDDDPAWTPVPDVGLVTAEAGSIEVSAL